MTPAPGASSTPDPAVVIAVLTYRRPQDLAEIVPMLVGQAHAANRPTSVLVVDNDPAGGAGDQVRAMHGARYVHEERPGISAARNRALREVGESDLLVFIDDDERPHTGWLDHLLAVYERSHPCAVVGPVVSSFAQRPSRWITHGRVFDRRRLNTGTEVTISATNNLLLDMAQVRALGLTFDERFGITGGSDTLFSAQLHARGGRTVWCQEAVVTDVVPAERATREWVLRRAYRAGNVWSRVQLLNAGPGLGRVRARGALALHGLARITGGSVRWVGGLVAGSLGARARAMRTMMRGAGMLTGMTGVAGLVYSEYRRPAPGRATRTAAS